MSKTNFKFNDKTLEYEKVEVSLRARLKKVGLHLGVSIVLALVIIIGSYPLVSRYSHHEKMQQIQTLESEYDVMNQKVKEMASQLQILKLRDDSVYALSLIHI